MEIERKFLVKYIPFDLKDYQNDPIQQAYISTAPVIRIRRKGSSYYLTCKGRGLLVREEFEIEISEEEYQKLFLKKEPGLIDKKRYYIPFSEDLTIELDVFHGSLEGLILCEVEFTSMSQAEAFMPPEWFGEEVTHQGEYQNSRLLQKTI